MTEPSPEAVEQMAKALALDIIGTPCPLFDEKSLTCGGIDIDPCDYCHAVIVLSAALRAVEQRTRLENEEGLRLAKAVVSKVAQGRCVELGCDEPVLQYCARHRGDWLDRSEIASLQPREAPKTEEPKPRKMRHGPLCRYEEIGQCECEPQPGREEGR